MVVAIKDLQTVWLGREILLLIPSVWILSQCKPFSSLVCQTSMVIKAHAQTP